MSIGTELKGYRRTAFKSKHDNLKDEKLRDFKARGLEVKAVKVGSYWLIYMKLDAKLPKLKNDEKTNNSDSVEPTAVNDS